ncbi:unnamed protein product, partial [Amoebophrya sp. A25]
EELEENRGAADQVDEDMIRKLEPKQELKEDQEEEASRSTGAALDALDDDFWAQGPSASSSFLGSKKTSAAKAKTAAAPKKAAAVRSKSTKATPKASGTRDSASSVESTADTEDSMVLVDKSAQKEKASSVSVKKNGPAPAPKKDQSVETTGEPGSANAAEDRAARFQNFDSWFRKKFRPVKYEPHLWTDFLLDLQKKQDPNRLTGHHVLEPLAVAPQRGLAFYDDITDVLLGFELERRFGFAGDQSTQLRLAGYAAPSSSTSS